MPQTHLLSTPPQPSTQRLLREFSEIRLTLCRATVTPLATTLFGLWLATAGCSSENPAQTPTGSPEQATAPFFELNFPFKHQNGMSGQYYFAEIVGSGCALFDFDRDGDLDLYAVQGGPLSTQPVDERPGDQLFQNLLVETGELEFRALPNAGFESATEYGMGAAVGDYDGDGWLDLYVTNFGPNQLWRNRGDGTFEDVTEVTGSGDTRWSCSAAFFDYDSDGDLDLYIGNYVDFRLETHKPCYAPSSAVDYCGPRSFRPYPDRLLRNDGDGTFTDVSAASRIATEFGGALGVITTDLNGDGRVDIYVANDGSANQLWLNNGDGTFTNDALLAGCAYNVDGKAEASMGIDAADVDNDGDEDLFMTHLTGETNTFYRNLGRGRFDDASIPSGLGTPSHALTGFGTAFFDYDNDGWLDVFIANGAVKTIERLAAAGDPFPLHQRNQLFRGEANGAFTEVVSDRLARSEVSRGAAFGDLDNDGDVDIAVCNNNGPLRLLRNDAPAGRWLGLQLLNESGHEIDGATVEVRFADGSSKWRRSRRAASYLCANDARVLIGLGEKRIVETKVHWSSGHVERFSVDEKRWQSIRRGAGERAP